MIDEARLRHSHFSNIYKIQFLSEKQLRSYHKFQYKHTTLEKYDVYKYTQRFVEDLLDKSEILVVYLNDNHMIKAMPVKHNKISIELISFDL